MTIIQVLHRFLRSEFEREAASGFALAKRIPDTNVRHFLDYYGDLNADERDEVANACTLRGAVWISGEEGAAHLETVKGLRAWQRLQHELVAGFGRDPHYYHSVQDLRACIAQAKCDKALGRPLSVPQDMVDYASTVRGVKASELRKRLRPAMEALFGAGLVSVGNRSGDYEGTLGGVRIGVGLDLGGQYWQLGYQVTVESHEPPGRLTRAGFEMALGMGLGHWNFIVEENLEDSIALLSKFVQYVSDLPKRMPPGCLQALS